MYKNATKLKLRFSSTKGNLTVEQLWDLPLNSQTKANLNDVARGVSQSITTVEDFVGGTSNDNSIAELKLDILKDIITDKKQELADKANKAKNETEIAKLEEILEHKEDVSLTKMSKKEIKAAIEKLRG
jgi:uncharacterized protein YaaW (UPF0174 family)